jgi:hypothetical protein
MARLRYRIIESLPDRVRGPAFADVADGQVRLSLHMEGDELTVIATGPDAGACEAVLRALRVDEMGVELCG